MQDMFETYMAPTLNNEGGGAYTNDPTDRGGETKWGVTVAVARAFGYTGPMQDLTRDEAMSVYRARFWVQPRFDQLSVISVPLAMLMLDLGVNMGTSAPGHFLQRALSVLGEQGALYPTVVVDGVCGAMTRSALRLLLGRRGSEGLRVVIQAVRAQAGVSYISMAESRPENQKYEFGWLSNRAFPLS